MLFRYRKWIIMAAEIHKNNIRSTLIYFSNALSLWTVSYWFRYTLQLSCELKYHPTHRPILVQNNYCSPCHQGTDRSFRALSIPNNVCCECVFTYNKWEGSVFVYASIWLYYSPKETIVDVFLGIGMIYRTLVYISMYQHLSLSLSLVLYFGYIHVYTQCRNHVDERMFNIVFFPGVCTSFKSLLLLYVSVFRYLNQCTDVNL